MPPGDEAGTLAQIARDYLQLSDVMLRIIGSDRIGEARRSRRRKPSPSRTRSGRRPTLVVKIQGDTDTLIRENQSAFVDSQGLFITVAAVSIALALLLGYVLSGSIVGPVRRMGTRLAAIASGDFSSHVEVSNRDELGELAANLNRMNDELGRLYECSRRRAGTNRSSWQRCRMSCERR